MIRSIGSATFIEMIGIRMINGQHELC